MNMTLYNETNLICFTYQRGLEFAIFYLKFMKTWVCTFRNQWKKSTIMRLGFWMSLFSDTFLIDDIVKRKLWRPYVLFKEQPVENSQLDKEPSKNKSIMSYFFNSKESKFEKFVEHKQKIYHPKHNIGWWEVN